MSEDTSPAAVIDDSIIETLYQLSQRYHSHGLYEPATRLLEFLLRHAPLRAGFHFALGKALHGRADHGRAAPSYRRAIKLGLPDINVYLYLGQCLIFMERFSEADAALRHFVGLARAQAAPDVATPQEQMAQHLLDHIVMPRLQAIPAESAQSSAGGRSMARTPSPRSKSMENTL